MDNFLFVASAWGVWEWVFVAVLVIGNLGCGVLAWVEERNANR